MKETKEEKMLSIISHLYWFYNADMYDTENQNDFKNSINDLELLIKQSDNE